MSINTRIAFLWLLALAVLLPGRTLAEENALDLIKKALQQFSSNNWLDTRQKLDLAANIATENIVKAEAAAWRGFASTKLGAAKVAEEDFAEALKFAEQAGDDANKAKAIVLRAQAWSADQSGGEPVVPINFMREAVRLHTTDAAFHLDLAIFLRRGKRANEAMEVIEASRLLNPPLVEFHRERGLAQMQLGHHPQAAEDFSEAIKAASQLQDYKSRAECWAAMGERGRAMADIEFVLAKTADADLVRLRAGLLEKGGDVAGSLADWTALVRQAPADPAAALGYARCLHKLGRHEEAHNALAGALYVDKNFREGQELHREVLTAWAEHDRQIVHINRKLKKDPGDATLLLQRFRRFKAMGADEQAKADLETVLAANPRQATALWLRGRDTLLAGQSAEALADLKLAAAAAPKDYTIGREYANCLKILDRTEESDRVWKRVQKLAKPTTAEGWEVLAKELGPGGYWPQAIESLDSAIKVEPKNPWLHYLRGHYVRRMDDPKFIAGANIHLREAANLLEASGDDKLMLSQVYAEMGKVYYHLALHRQVQADVLGTGAFSGEQGGGILANAVKHFDKAIELEPHSFSYYVDRGMCKFGLGEWDQANADFKVFVAANPNYTETLKKRMAWWTELHEIWQKSNEESLRQLEEFTRWNRWYLDNSDYCSQCDRRVGNWETHSH